MTRTTNDTTDGAGGTVDVSIVLVNWNAGALTCDALESIRERVRDATYEVFVVDNNSTRDESKTLIPTTHPWVRFVANPDNVGFSKANNQAIREARGRYVLLLNNDTIQIEDAIGKTVEYMDRNPKVGAVGILHLNADQARSPQDSFFPFPQPWRESLGLLTGGGEPAVRPEIVEQDVDWIVGSYLFARAECLREVGDLDERFFLYDEDVDWCLRARRLGWTIRFWPGAKMIHIGSAVRPFMRDKTFIHFRSHLSYIRKNQSLAAAATYYGAMSARLTLATLWQAVRALTGRATFADVAERFDRQMKFTFLKSGRVGVP